MSSADRASAELLRRQLSWTAAALELCLDMERNESDGKYARSPLNPEIVYVFDEDVFELFVGAFDELEEKQDSKARIYRDRRQAVGIFHTRQWRRDVISATREEQRIRTNRQSALLTSEWLFSGKLPGMRDGTVYVSSQHLVELGNRWSRLMDYFRQRFREEGGCPDEVRRVDQLSEDLSTTVLTGALVTSLDSIRGYIEQQRYPLRADLHNLLLGLQQLSESGPAALVEEDAQNFWRFAFNRKLAELLANLRITGPIGQLVRINSELTRNIRFLHTVGELDEPAQVPDWERADFWFRRLHDELQRRGSPREGREGAIRNDAQTLALVQAYANAAVRRGENRRFVFVTADELLVDVYRAWHCNEASARDPFVLRTIRHYAPLLNVKDMADHASDAPKERNLKSEIFPSLRLAIEPFLLKLNISAPEESVRKSREWFLLKLKGILADLELRGRTGKELSTAEIKNQVASLSIFNDPTAELPAIDSQLEKISGSGREIERAVLGFGWPWLAARLETLRPFSELQQKVAAGDESALAAYVRDLVDSFDEQNLWLHAKFFDISSELNSMARPIRDSGRVPLALRLTYRRGEEDVLLTQEVVDIIARAGAQTNPRDLASPPTFEVDNVQDAGYRLFALYCCLALHLSKWDVAYRCALEAKRRAEKSESATGDLPDLEYLVALCIRFRLGAGPIVDAGQADVTAVEFASAEALLTAQAGRGPRLLRLRAASERVSLQLFGCAWALTQLAGAEDGGPRSPLFFDQSFLTERLAKAGDLLAALYPAASAPDPDLENLPMLRDQMGVNFAASYCIRAAAERSSALEGVAFPPIMTDEQHEWLELFLEREKLPSPPRPPVTQLLGCWYLHLRGRLPEPPATSLDRRTSLPLDRSLAVALRALLAGAKHPISIKTPA